MLIVILPSNKQLLNLHGTNGQHKQSGYTSAGPCCMPLEVFSVEWRSAFFSTSNTHKNIQTTNVSQKCDLDHCLLAPTVA